MLVLTEAWWRRGNTFASHCYGLGSTQTTAMHTPAMHVPCHTCPPAMHPPPCIPPAMQTPPLPCHPSPAKYTPVLPCTPPYRGGSSLSCMVGGMHGGGHEWWGGGGACVAEACMWCVFHPSQPVSGGFPLGFSSTLRRARNCLIGTIS